MRGIAQNHIKAEELETAAIACLVTITQQAAPDIVDNACMEQITQHVSQPQLQLPQPLPQPLPLLLPHRLALVIFVLVAHQTTQTSAVVVTLSEHAMLMEVSQSVVSRHMVVLALYAPDTLKENRLK
jgi:hypothetical protein